MTDLWDEAMEAAARFHEDRAASFRRGRSRIDAEAHEGYAAAIRELPRPSEADLQAAIVKAALAWSRALAIWRATGRVALYSFEDKLAAACVAEIAAQTGKEINA